MYVFKICGNIIFYTLHMFQQNKQKCTKPKFSNFSNFIITIIQNIIIFMFSEIIWRYEWNNKLAQENICGVWNA